MYNVVGGRYAKFTASFGAPKLRFHLELEYADGSKDVVGSDGSWKTAPGPIVFSCIYGGEDYDARLEEARLGSRWLRRFEVARRERLRGARRRPGGAVLTGGARSEALQDRQRERDEAGRVPVRPGDELRGQAENSSARRGGAEDPAHARNWSTRRAVQTEGDGLSGVVRVHAERFRPGDVDAELRLHRLPLSASGGRKAR